MFKIDLHTHSNASPDGGIRLAQYKRTLDQGVLDYIAITDHNTIAGAQQVQNTLGDRIIIGQEIAAREGEIIGLFLQEAVPKGLGIQEVIARIRAQGGLVYIPHAFESVRKGLSINVLDTIANDIDIVEVCNGRAVTQHSNARAVVWARHHELPGAASSDAHGVHGLGRTFTTIRAVPTVDNLPTLLMRSSLQARLPSVRAVLYPTWNRTRKKMSRHRG